MLFTLGPVKLFLNPFAFYLLAALYVIVLYSLMFGFFKNLPMEWPHWVALLMVPLFGVYTREPTPEVDKEPYTSFQNSLNDISGSGQTQTPTQWLNMGYWSPGCTFPEACRDLALKVARSACIYPGDVLDVGFGSGDSLLLQLEDPSIPRPKSLTGVTSISHQYEAALKRVDDLRRTTQIPIVLQHDDAVYKSPSTRGTGSRQSTHPLDPSSDLLFDSILALDCAYHFNTREEFLAQCFDHLKPSGRISLADMCFEPKTSNHFWSKTTAKLWANALSVPSSNLITLSQYRAQLERIGYTDIAVVDVSDNVFPGFIAFLSTRGVLWKLFAGTLRRWWTFGGRFVLVTACKRENV